MAALSVARRAVGQRGVSARGAGEREQKALSLGAGLSPGRVVPDSL